MPPWAFATTRQTPLARPWEETTSPSKKTADDEGKSEYPRQALGGGSEDLGTHLIEG